MLVADLVFTLQYKFYVGFQIFMKQSCPWQHAQFYVIINASTKYKDRQ